MSDTATPVTYVRTARTKIEEFKSYIHDFANDIESGTVKINRTTTGNLINAPFGGLKRSSTSTFRESGRTGLEFYTQIKTVYRGC
jgi:acyl-CoA reductase-like NAD-dependent aldehyde dehydrogenase